ncbi:hemerythrin domain-containing protein [Sporosarcina sp. FSL W7-1349]|uniref:hemerythrin domain-containing protein n=1 Tax=Sporosarcina sp. FSL W7-1349 TaxID=2921561 RepID=UPI0030F96EFE
MTGPALKQLHSHRAIHDGGLSGATDKTEVMMDFLRQGDLKSANEAADELIDFWITRVISHADAEEEGLYKDIAEQNPNLKEAIIQLTRDHDLLRIIVKDIQELREQEELSPNVLHKFHALLVVNEIHSRDEERMLLE